MLHFSGVTFDSSVFRVLRLFRILQLEHFVSAFTLLGNVWDSCKATLAATGLLALVVWIGSACLFYLFEKVRPFVSPLCLSYSSTADVYDMMLTIECSTDGAFFFSAGGAMSSSLWL